MRALFGSAALCALAILAPTAAEGESPYAGSTVVGDDVLAQQRGGFVLPGGLDVSFSVQLDTFVDGQLALRTVLTPETAQGPVVNVYALTTDDSVTLNGQAVTGDAQPAPAAPQGVLVQVENVGGVGSMRPVAAMQSGSSVVVVGGAAADGAGAMEPLPLVPGGPAIQTAYGLVSISQGANGTLVRLDDPSLQLRHLVGNATANAVGNLANGRAIETLTTVNIDLQNATPLNLGSSMFRVDDAVAAAARGTQY